MEPAIFAGYTKTEILNLYLLSMGANLRRSLTATFCLILCLVFQEVSAQNAEINGQIKQSATTQPLTGVSVYLEGTSIGSVSNAKGLYKIQGIPAGKYTLVARSIGYDLKRLEVTLDEGDQVSIDFQLSENFTEISGIVVRGSTLTGGNAGINDIPGSAQYISPKELERFNYNDVNRVLRSIPGINIQEEEGFGLRPNIGMRGTGVERSSKITLMEDGILVAPAPYAAPSAYYFPTVGRMQGIEVRKGSSQIKYGPYTTGGAINFISTQIPKAFAGRVNILAGDFGQRIVHANVGQSFENVGFLLETYQAGSEGFKELDNGGETGFDNKDYLAKLRFNTDLDAKIYQSITFKLGQTIGVSDETYLGLTQDDFDATPFRRYAGSQVDLMDTEQRQLSIQHIIRPAKFLDITTTFYRNEFERNWYKLDKVRNASGTSGIGSILDNPEDFQSKYQTIAGNGLDTLLVKANNREYYSQGVQSIIGLQFDNGTVSHNIEIGLRFHKDEMDRFQWVDDYVIEDGTMQLIRAGVPGTESNRIHTAEAFAGFIQYTANIGDFTFTPGLRYEDITMRREDFGKNDVGREGTDLGVRENKVDVFIPGMGIDYQLNKNISVFAGVHKGFTPPGTTEGTEPETSVNYEGGLRYQRSSLSINAVAYLNDYGNLLGSDLAATGGAGTTDQFNGGEALVRGAEVELRYNLLERSASNFSLPVALAYTYTHAEFRNSFESEFEAWGEVAEGDGLPYLSEHQLAINLTLEHKRFDINVSGKYTSDMRTVAGTGSIPSENLIGAQFITDISSNVFVNRNLTLFGSIRNLTDEAYLVSRRPAGLRPGMPRNFKVGIKAIF